MKSTPVQKVARKSCYAFIMSQADLQPDLAEQLILIPKFAPEGAWRTLSQGRNEKWEYAVGMVVDDPELRGALSMQLHCMRSIRPMMVSYQFGLFYRDFGSHKRAYMLESGDPQIGTETDHSWPHEHRGAGVRINIPLNQVPTTFCDVIDRFLNTCSIEVETPIEDPFEFRLKP